MSVIQTHAQTQFEPAFFTYTNPDWCVTCGEEHDLDDGEDHKVIEGGPDGDFVLCHHCDLYCDGCGDSVTETACNIWSVKPGTTFRDGKAICLNCEKEAVMAQWHEATGGQYHA
jgi:hypothetical protein